jgi:hypothetical protein
MPLTDEVLSQRFKVLIFSLAWIACFIGFITSVVHTRNFLDSAVAVPGRVVALNAGGSHPQIEFINKRGELNSYPQGGWIAGYKVGDKVTVLYLVESPTLVATIDRVGAIWSLTIFLGAMVIGFPLIGLSIILCRKLSGREERGRWDIID